jgi:hypothetical protein
MRFDPTAILLAVDDDLPRDHKQELLTVSIGMIVFGTLMLLGAFLGLALPLYRRLCWVRTVGVIFRRMPADDPPEVRNRWATLAAVLDAESDDDRPTAVRFHDLEGREQRVFVAISHESSYVPDGARVPIRYNADNPARAAVDEIPVGTVMCLGFFGGGLLFSGLLLLLLPFGPLH